MNDTRNDNSTGRVFKRSALLSSARILQVAVTFLVFWFYSLRLAKEDYGIFQQVFVLVSFFSGILFLGLPLLIASLPAKGSGKYIRGIIRKNKLIYTAIFSSCVIFIMVFCHFISLYERLLVALLVIANAGCILLELYLVKIHRDKFVLVSNILYSMLFLAIHYFIIDQDIFSLQQLIMFLLILSAFRLLLMFLMNRQYIREDMHILNAETNDNYLSQWKFLSLNEALDTISKQADKLFLLWLLSAAAFAVYFNGSYEIPLLGILISTSGTFITMHAVDEQNSHAIKKILGDSAVFLSLILFPLFFMLLFNGRPLFHFIFNGRYDESAQIFLISCCIIPLRIMNYTAILQAMHKGREILTGSIIGLLSKLILSIILYFYWDVRGVALAYILGTTIQISYYLYATSRFLNTPLPALLPYTKLFIILLLTGLCSYACTFITGMEHYMQRIFIGLAGMILIIVGGMWILLKKKKGSQPFST